MLVTRIRESPKKCPKISGLPAGDREKSLHNWEQSGTTVDGRNPANQLRLVVHSSHYLRGF